MTDQGTITDPVAGQAPPSVLETQARDWTEQTARSTAWYWQRQLLAGESLLGGRTDVVGVVLRKVQENCAAFEQREGLTIWG